MKTKAVLSKILDGAGAGLVAGITAAAMLSIMAIKDRRGDLASAITFVSSPDRSGKLAAGWLIELAVGVGIGVVFGLLFATLKPRLEFAAFWGIVFGVAWWALGWLMLVPTQLRFAPWAGVRDPSQLQVAVAGGLAALAYAAMLAIVFTALERASARFARSGGS